VQANQRPPLHPLEPFFLTLPRIGSVFEAISPSLPDAQATMAEASSFPATPVLPSAVCRFYDDPISLIHRWIQTTAANANDGRTDTGDRRQVPASRADAARERDERDMIANHAAPPRSPAVRPCTHQQASGHRLPIPGQVALARSPLHCTTHRHTITADSPMPCCRAVAMAPVCRGGARSSCCAVGPVTPTSLTTSNGGPTPS